MALPVVAFAMFVAANVGLFVLFPLAVWWGAFAYWFPARAQQVIDFVKRTWALLKEYYAKAIELLTWTYNHREEAYANAKEYIAGLFGKKQQSEEAAAAVAGDAEAAKSPSYYEQAKELALSYYKQASELALTYYKQASELALTYYGKATEFLARLYSAAKDFITSTLSRMYFCIFSRFVRYDPSLYIQYNTCGCALMGHPVSKF